MRETPSIETLLLHRGTMLMLDEVLSFSAQSIRCALRVPAGAWYLNDRLEMPGWIGIELMAQSVAAHVAMCARENGRENKEGVLLGTRKYSARQAAICSGETLTVSATVVFLEDNGLGVYDCAIQGETQPIAEAVLKVFEPDNFDEFLANAKAHS